MYIRNQKDIEDIKNWITTQKFLPQDLTDDFIFTFLWGCGGDIPKTKRVVSNYFYARQSIPEIFTRRDPFLKENIAAWKATVFLPLESKHNGCRVFVGSSSEPENYDFVHFVKQVFMCFDLLIQKNYWESGDRILIINYDGFRMKSLKSYTSYIVRKTAECGGSNYLPGKIRGIHNVNIPTFMFTIHELFKPYLSSEEKKVIKYHKTYKSLHKYINPDVLPSEFGGNAGPIQTMSDKWYEVLKTNRNFFVNEEEKRMQETKATATGRGRESINY